MIGFYDYTVVLTYLGLLCSIFGMFQAMDGFYFNAILCLGGALFCDTMDGKVARAKKNRTKQESQFGIQIDSLCDVISFGAFPAVICYSVGLRDWLGLVCIGYYCLCCVIRLGYFNVLAQEKKEGEKSVYHGLPVVGLAVLMPLAFVMKMLGGDAAFLWVLRFLLAGVGTLYILDFKMNKPRNLALALISLVFWIPVAVLWVNR